MTSWITWDIWLNRVWGSAEPSAPDEPLPEVAHEPSRLPAELLARAKDDLPR